MSPRTVVCCIVTAGLALAGLGLAGALSSWGFSWVTITSEETDQPPTTTPTVTAEASLPSLPEDSEGITYTTNTQYPPGSEWTVFAVPSALNVRAGPSTNHQILGTAELGSTVTLTGQVAESEASGTWVQARTAVVTGWVFSTYLTPVPPNPQ